jgi:hypothetical protein
VGVISSVLKLTIESKDTAALDVPETVPQGKRMFAIAFDLDTETLMTTYGTAFYNNATPTLT